MHNNAEFIDALNQIEKEKGINKEVIFDAIETSLISACKKNFGTSQNIKVVVDRETGNVQVFAQKEVVNEVMDDFLEISLERAAEINPAYNLGDIVDIVITPRNFGRVAAQTAKQVVVQKFREAEREILFKEYITKEKEVVTGIVQRKERKNVIIALGKIDAVLPPNEQIIFENYNFNDRIKIYVVEVKQTPKGPMINVSRTHPDLIKRLFEQEVPEVHDGVVEIKSIAREAGSRTKMAVYSKNPDVDAVGACVGPNGYRVNIIVNELRGEKIDIINYSEVPEEFIKSALSPSKVVDVQVDKRLQSAKIVVPDHQLSLAIGKEGQNARLAAKLTGWKIDIKSEAQAKETNFIKKIPKEKLENVFVSEELEISSIIEDDSVAIVTKKDKKIKVNIEELENEDFESEIDEIENLDSSEEIFIEDIEEEIKVNIEELENENFESDIDEIENLDGSGEILIEGVEELENENFESDIDEIESLNSFEEIFIEDIEEEIKVNIEELENENFESDIDEIENLDSSEEIFIEGIEELENENFELEIDEIESLNSSEEIFIEDIEEEIKVNIEELENENFESDIDEIENLDSSGKIFIEGIEELKNENFELDIDEIENLDSSEEIFTEGIEEEIKVNIEELENEDFESDIDEIENLDNSEEIFMDDDEESINFEKEDTTYLYKDLEEEESIPKKLQDPDFLYEDSDDETTPSEDDLKYLEDELDFSEEDLYKLDGSIDDSYDEEDLY